MEQKTAREIQEALVKPFAPEDLEWRLQQVNETTPWGLAVPYVTNRAIQARLDEVVGPENWYNQFQPWHNTGKKDSQICGISIFFEGRGWITKWDGAEDTDIEPIKGGLSDSMKRAAVQWGIGRVLYNMDAVFVDVEKRGKSWIIAKKDQAKLNEAYLKTLKALGLNPTKPVGRQIQAPASEPEKKPKAPSTPAGKDMPKVIQKPEQTPPVSETVPYEFKVVASKVQGGMSGRNTRLVLEAPDGKRLNAFARGEHSALGLGTLLAGTKLTMKKQDNVVFYVLEDYRVVSFQEAA